MAKFLITRPEPDNQRTARNLEAAGLESVSIPFLRFELRNAALPHSASFSALALTSANAIRALQELGFMDQLRDLPLFAVGEKTADAARAAGFSSIATAGGSLAGLAETIRENPPPGPLLYPAAHDLSGDLRQQLHGSGILVEYFPVYGMRAKTHLSAREKCLIDHENFAGALFYSRRTAQAFLTASENAGLDVENRVNALCLSQNIAKLFRKAKFASVEVAGAPNERAMIALALSFAAPARK